MRNDEIYPGPAADEGVRRIHMILAKVLEQQINQSLVLKEKMDATQLMP